MTAIRYCLIFFIVFISFVFGIFSFFIQHEQIDFSALHNYNAGRPTLLLDDEGNEWTRFALDRREPIDFMHVPLHVKNAFVAAEDHFFWSHWGISLRGIFRSLITNCYHGKIVQGASTITQQLVKLLFFDSQRTFKRKIKEQFCALLVERYCTKEQILETYLNHVYFGCGIYGIEAAAQRFWSKHAQDLTLAEAAMLAGVLKSPGQYCPLLYPLSARKRRDIVLASMRKLNFIADDEYESAKNSALDLVQESIEPLAPHLKETVRIFLESLVGRDQLYTGGLLVQTTLNKKIQAEAQKAFEKQIEQLRKTMLPNIDGALICMHGKTGEIKALVGGANFGLSQFNRALQAKRQFGSIFKPFVYAAAIDNGMHFAQTAYDEPLSIDKAGNVWQPRNSTRRYEGQMTLARALSYSNNIITIKTLLAIGVDKVVALAKKLRLSGEILPYPSLALGCVDGTLKEAVGMFNVFANAGIYVEPHTIKWVKDGFGKKIWKKKIDSERIASNYVISQVTRVLGIGMSRIKVRYADEWINAQAISKTGTTNDCRTNWFCAATPTYTTALYIGYDDNRSMGKHVYGTRTVFPIWLNLNKTLPTPKKMFEFDTRLKKILVDSKTGVQVASTDYPGIVFSLLVPEDYAQNSQVTI